MANHSYSSASVEHVAQNVHDAAHGAQAHHAAHELPNLITVLNHHFGDVSWVRFLHRWENIFFSVVVALIFAGIFTLAARKESLIPDGIRNFIEIIVEGFENFMVMIMGEPGRQHVPFVATLFIYILFMNWSGLIPFSKSPTSSWSVTAGMAVIAIIYIHGNGIRNLGLGAYLHHMASSPKALIHWVIGVLLLFPLNLVLDVLILPFSLSLRLFANISSEDSLLYSFAQLNVASHFLAIPLQIFANILAILFSVIQAMVFTLLTAVYISLFVPHEDHAVDVRHAHSP